MVICKHIWNIPLRYKTFLSQIEGLEIKTLRLNSVLFHLL